MEKIYKEELMKKLNLTEEELEKVAGGYGIKDIKEVEECMRQCSEFHAKQGTPPGPCYEGCWY